MEKGADINRVDEYGMTAIMRVADGIRAQEHTDAIDLLLEKGLNINSVDKKGRTVIMRAAKKRNQDIVKFLLDKGADTEIKDEDGKTLLDICQESEYSKRDLKEVIDILINASDISQDVGHEQKERAIELQEVVENGNEEQTDDL